MAPKRKSTPSQNPLRSGAPSSSDPTPSHLRFHDEDARKDSSENFSWRGVHSKRRVILANFADTDLPTVIHSRGWESLCDISVTCLFVVIQEFYSNMHGFDFSIPLFSIRILRYAHCYHTVTGYGCASCSESRASWLPRLWASADYVQNQDDFRFLWASHRLGWSSVYTM